MPGCTRKLEVRAFPRNVSSLDLYLLAVQVCPQLLPSHSGMQRCPDTGSLTLKKCISEANTVLLANCLTIEPDALFSYHKSIQVVPYMYRLYITRSSS